MSTVELTFAGVSIPTNTSASVTIFEDTNGDGTADSSDTIALSNNVTSYTSANVFAEGPGNSYWLDFDLGNTDVTLTASVTAPITLTVDTDVTSIATKTSAIGNFKTAGIVGTHNIPASRTVAIGSPAISTVLGAGDLAASRTTVIGSPHSSSLINLGRYIIGSKDSVVGSPKTVKTYSNAWMLANIPLKTLIEERGKWNEVTLKYRATESDVSSIFSDFEKKAGEVSSTVDVDGKFKAYDRASGVNTFNLRPPYTRRNFRHEGNYFTKKYNQTPVDQAGKQFEVMMKMIPEESLTLDTEQINETPTVDDWHFSFSNGSFATDRVKAQIKDKAKKGIGSKTLNLILKQEEFKLLAQHAARQGSVRVRSIPDGDNLYEDTSEDERQTMYIVPPNERSVEEGSYRITQWEDRWVGDKHEVTITIGKVDSGNKQVSKSSTKTATLLTT